jgi:hypothetical protein
MYSLLWVDRSVIGSKSKVDVTKYSWPVSLPEKPNLRAVGTRRRIWLEGEFFGPIPAWWLIQALRAGIRKSYGAVFIGLLLWRQYWLERQKQPLKLTGAVLKKFGLEKRFARHALDTLEKAGLIYVQKFNYRSPQITIVTEEKDYFYGRRD